MLTLSAPVLYCLALELGPILIWFTVCW